MARRSDRMDALVSLSKRRGFVYPSSEIYGGLRAAWDYGPLGVEMKENVKRLWWRAMVQERDDIVGLDSSVILATEVWQASGHLTEFVDPLTECQSCHRRFRADHLDRGVRPRSAATPRRTAWPTSPAPTAGPAGRSPSPGCSTGCCGPTSGPTEDESGAGLPAPGDGPGHLHQLQERPADLAQEGPVRHRPDRQVVPQRDHAGQLHLPHPRVRADGDGVLRPARHRRGVAPALDRHPAGLVHRPRPGQGQPAAVRAPEGEAVPLLQADRRHRVPVRLRAAASGASWRASPTAPTST